MNNRLMYFGLLQHVIEAREKANARKNSIEQQEANGQVLQEEKERPLEQRHLLAIIYQRIDNYSKLKAY